MSGGAEFIELSDVSWEISWFKYNADLIPNLLNGMGTKFGVATDEAERMIDGLGDEDSILLTRRFANEWIAMM